MNLCRNHPDVIAAGLCNECGGSYCGDCLRILKVYPGGLEAVNLYLCPNCLKDKYHRSVRGFVFFCIPVAIFFFLFGFLFKAGSELTTFSIVIGIVFIAMGLYAIMQPLKAPTVYEKLGRLD